MGNENQHVVIDAGNTFVKIALFIDGQLSDIQRIETMSFLSNPTFEHPHKSLRGIISSVLNNESTNQLHAFFPKTVILTTQSNLPIELKYDTPHSLGIDRICNAVSMWTKNPKKGSVSIDIGSCIKFDYVDKNGAYQGGSISPGLKMRYKSMNDYTANLPLINETTVPSIIGKSTNGSMHAGVILGMHAEIFGFIQRYLEIDKDLTFFMTGGDAKYFDFHSKNNIFAIENLTLEGLYQIFLFNDQ